MFYEEEWINGVLMCRTKPKGEWREVQGVQMVAVPKALLARLESDRTDLYNLTEGKVDLVSSNLTQNMWKLANTKWKEV